MKWVPVQTLNQQKSDGTNLTCKRRISTNVRPIQRSDQYKRQTNTKVRPVQTSDQYKGQTSTNVTFLKTPRMHNAYL